MKKSNHNRRIDIPPASGGEVLGAFFALCLLCTPALADTTPAASLFFTPDEARQIEVLKQKNPVPLGDTGDVHLGAVFYYGERNWVLWLQGQRWTPETDRADLHVLEVTADHVRLSLAAAAGLPLREITLKPYQTYQLSTGKVVEGSASSPLPAK